MRLERHIDKIAIVLGGAGLVALLVIAVMVAWALFDVVKEVIR